MAVDDGWVWITNWLAAAGLTTMRWDGRRGEAAAAEVERDRLGRVVGQVRERGHAARHGDRVVPWSGPVPLSSDAVTTVLLSPVSMLPY